jgi:hypothetical protein
VRDEKFEARPYDPADATTPRPGSTERPQRPGSPNGASGPPPAGDQDPGTRPYTRDRSGDTTKPLPKDEFSDPAKPAPAPGTPAKKPEPTFGTETETKKPTVPVQQRGADKKEKAPILTPDDPYVPDAAPPSKSKTDLKKPSAENRSDELPLKKVSALTLQERSTWHLSGISRPLFGQIAQSTVPLPERLSPSTGDWAVLSADEAQVVRR